MALPPGAPPQAAPPSAPPGPAQGAPPQGGGDGGASPSAFLQMIQKGFQGLAPMIKAAGHQLPPEDIQLFMQAQKTTEALIQSLTQGPSQSPQAAAPAKPSPGGQMPPGAAKGSVPSNYGGG